jgi:hypothetical protein
MQVYNESGILPNFLSLYHNERELDKDETVESASILAGDTIVVKEIDRIDLSDDDEVEQERGFGGTALTGRISQSIPPRLSLRRVARWKSELTAL